MSTANASRRRLVYQIILVLAILAAALTLLALIGAFRTPAGSHQVTLRVEASGGYALITFQAGGENETAPQTVNTPWQKRVTLKPGDPVYLTAANPSQAGRLSCILLLDGDSWKEEEKAAPKDGVACAGIVP